MHAPFDQKERRQLLERREQALRNYNDLMEQGAASLPWSDAENSAYAAAARHLESAETIEAEYFARLPRLAMSCCPFDDRPLYRSFDPHGFDGPWWRSDASPAEPPSCPHLCHLRGAVQLLPRDPQRMRAPGQPR